MQVCEVCTHKKKCEIAPLTINNKKVICNIARHVACKIVTKTGDKMQSIDSTEKTDATLVRVQKILEQYPNAQRDMLIPILQQIQQECGYLSRESMIAVGKHIGLPASKVYGVATFYNQFRFHAAGKYHVQVCRGTACHVKGSAKVLDALKIVLGIEPGKTTRDGMFSLEVVACLGACGLAPVVKINDDFYAGVTPKQVDDIIRELKAKEVES